jgi:hypothetical protein
MAPTNYLDELAIAIYHEISPEALPDKDTSLLFRLYAVLARAKGEAVTREDVHDAWVVWMLQRDPGHRSIRPFKQLDTRTQQEDEPFVEAIRKVARQQGHSQ